MLHSATFTGCIILLCASGLSAAEWGNLSLRFVYDGEPPKPRSIKVAPDKEIPDESLLIEAKGKGLANICVWLIHDGGEPPPVHPNQQLAGNDKFAGTIRDGRIDPRVMVVRPPQSLQIRNDDSHGYSAQIDSLYNPPVNVLLRSRDTYAKFIEREEVFPVRLDCTVHPFLIGYVLIRSTPYSAVSDASGNIVFKNLPTGERTFVVWHERMGYVKQATYGGKEVKWPRGQFKLDVKPGENVLGDVRLSPDLFRLTEK